MNGIANQSDILAIEARGMPADLPTSTYEMIRRGAAINPSAPALSFFLRAADHRKAQTWTYHELVRDITRTANLLTRLGIRRDEVVAYVLPNLPETHFVIWGGEAAGTVCAINPLPVVLRLRAVMDRSKSFEVALQRRRQGFERGVHVGKHGVAAAICGRLVHVEDRPHRRLFITRHVGVPLLAGDVL